MKLWNLTAKASVATLLIAGAALMNACQSGGLEAYGRAPNGWVAPEGDDMGWTKPAPKPAPVAAKPAPAPAPAKPAPAPVMVGGDQLCLPTGDRATSALCLRCSMPREVIAGANFTYDIEVCNVSSVELQNVMVTYSLDGARIVSSDPTMTGGGFAIGNLGPKACKTIKVTANAAGTGSVRGCMGATWNNSLCCGTTVVQPALKVVKSVTPDNGTPCDTYTYKIDVTNTGTGAATNVKITDNLPAGVTSDGKSALTFDAGSLAAGQTRSFTFTAKAGKTGSYSNEATASADNGLTAKSNAVGITVKAPVLAIAKTCPTSQFIGRPAAFKITVSNKGDAPATNTRVEDALPAGATFASASDGGVFAGGKVTWNLGTLAPGASKELTVTTNVAAVGSLQNAVTASATCAETVSANCTFSIQGVPDLGTLLDDNDGVVVVGDSHIYRYEVANQGQIDLTNVQVVVTLPEGMSFVSSTAPKAPAVAGNKLTFTGVTGILKPGERRSFTLTVRSAQAGEKLVISETTCDQLKTPVRDDELTNFVER